MNEIDVRYIKDPEAKLDYSFDWTDWLDSKAKPPESITQHTITVPKGLTLVSSVAVGGVVTAWISGGTVGMIYRVECLITTSIGRIDERSLWLVIQER